jgi:hypothetical protein
LVGRPLKMRHIGPFHGRHLMILDALADHESVRGEGERDPPLLQVSNVRLLRRPLRNPRIRYLH